MKLVIVLIVVTTITSFGFQFMYDYTYNKGFDKGYRSGYNDGICVMVFKIIPNRSECSAEETDSGTLIFVK